MLVATKPSLDLLVQPDEGRQQEGDDGDEERADRARVAEAVGAASLVAACAVRAVPVDNDLPGFRHLEHGPRAVVVADWFGVLLAIQEELEPEVLPAKCLAAAVEQAWRFPVVVLMDRIDQGRAPAAVAVEVGRLFAAAMSALERRTNDATPVITSLHAVRNGERKELVLVVQLLRVTESGEADVLATLFDEACIDTGVRRNLPGLQVHRLFALVSLAERVIDLLLVSALVVDDHLVRVGQLDDLALSSDRLLVRPTAAEALAHTCLDLLSPPPLILRIFEAGVHADGVYHRLRGLSSFVRDGRLPFVDI